MDEKKYNNNITIRKLYPDNESSKGDNEYFDKILDENRKLPNEWFEIYPYHLEWINKVVKELKSGVGSRIAIGGFFEDPYSGKTILGCSAILKKAEYSSHIEIKNLLIFDTHPYSDPHNVRRYYQQDIIQYVRKFAEFRGYPRLLTEIPKKGQNNRELRKVFFKKDFEVAGSWIDRYSKDDQVVILSSEVNPICGLDSYDNYGVSKWIIEKELNGKFEKEEVVKVVDKNGNNATLTSLIYNCGNKKLADFYLKVRVIVLHENTHVINKLYDITDLLLIEDNSVHLNYIFNFSNVINVNSDSVDGNITFIKDKKFIVIGREGLMNLLKAKDGSLLNKRRIEYDEVGGILLISNPIKFNVKKYIGNLVNNINSVYIKLGTFGENVRKDMPVYFAYYNNKNSYEGIKPWIWGRAILARDPITEDINHLQDLHRKDKKNELLSDGELLYQTISGMNDEDDVEEPLWEPHEFESHNIFNSTKKVVTYSIKSFKYLHNEDNKVFITDVESIYDYLRNSYKRDYVRSLFDFYLNKDEVDVLESKFDVYKELSVGSYVNIDTPALPREIEYNNNRGFVDTYRINPISLGFSNTIKKVKIFVYQFESDFKEDWYEEDGFYKLKDINKVKKIVSDVTEKAKNENCQMVVFPELSIPYELIEWIKSDFKNDLIVIAGSHYYTRNNKTISRCPIIYNNQVNYTEKILPSPLEYTGIISQNISNGSEITFFSDTPIGSFFVLICSDNLSAQFIRNECLKHSPDFIIVISFQSSSEPYHIALSDVINSYDSLYYIYSNNLCKNYSDGSSAFFGRTWSHLKNRLIDSRHTDFKPIGKLFELKEKHNYFIVEADISNKNPSQKRQVEDNPNVSFEKGLL